MKIPFIKKCLLLLLLVASGSMAMGEDTYKLVKSNSELKSGALYVIISSNDKGLCGLGKTSDKNEYRQAVAVTVLADSTVRCEGDLCPLKLTKVKEGKWTLKDTVSVKYLKWSSGNKLPSGDLVQDSYFTITINSDNSARIQSKKDATRYIQYYPKSPRFACYSSNQKPVFLYKQVTKEVENPVFTPEGGTQDKPTLVEYGKEIKVSTSTEGADIYIKNDDVFNLLSPPIIIARSKLFSVVAKAKKADYDDSEEVTGWYATFISTPTFSISDTMVVKNTPLSLNCSTSSYATIYYRINDEKYKQYTSPIQISDDCTISAYATMSIDGEEWKSDTSSVKYTIKKPIVMRCVFKETFDDVTGYGGNDNQWEGSAGNSPIETSYSHYRDWLFTKAYKASQCLKIGTGSEKGSVTTPPINYAGEVLLTFRAAAWNGNKEKTSITVSIGNINQDYSLQKSAFSDYSLKIENLESNDKIIFSSKVANNNRFFLDDIYVYAAIKDTTSHTDYALNGYWTCEDMCDLFNKNPNITHLDLLNMEREEGIQESIPKNSNCLIFTTEALGLEKNEVIGDSCANLVLTDNLPYSIKEEFTATNASYSRSAYRDGGWETLMVPYDVSDLPNGYLFEKFVGINNNEVTFQPVTSLVAHTPYIMKYIGEDVATNAKDNNFSLSATNIKISVDPGQSLAFKGTDTEISGEGKYILNADGTQFGIGTAASMIKPFHAYLEIENQSKAPAYRVIHTTEQATVMDKVEIQPLRIHSGNGSILIECQDLRTIDIYSLDGWLIRRVDLYPGKNHIDGLAPGVYLINRQKVCVK